MEYINSRCCFTYQDEKFRLVFLNRDLNDEEALIVLAHEEGHIWHNHLVRESVFGSEVKQEFEANEFVHYLLSDDESKRRKQMKIFLACFVTIILIVGGCFVSKFVEERRSYTDNYYKTRSGTKYHIEGCVYLKNKSDVQKLSKEEFDSGMYEPCASCVQFEDND